MAEFIALTGIIRRIDRFQGNGPQAGCELMMNFSSREQGNVNMIVDGKTYVPDGRRLRSGDSVTFFYSASAPVPRIFPPQYRAVAAVPTSGGLSAVLDTFTRRNAGGQLRNSDDSLRLNVSNRTPVMLPNGQPFNGALSGKLLLVIYRITTASIPPQTPPERIIVFCR